MWERFRRALLNSLSTTLLHIWKWVAAFWRKNGLLTLSMLSVATGCLLGFLLRALELTELVSLAGIGTGARGMEQGSWGNQPWCQQDITIQGPRWAQPQKQRLLPKETTPQGRFLPMAFFFSFLTKKLPTNAKAAGQILPPSTGSGGLRDRPCGAAGDSRSMRVGKRVMDARLLGER